MASKHVQGPCSWCGGQGFGKIGTVVLCDGCYEFAILHWR